VAAGGGDRAAPNNFALWPYAQANSTFLNYSCSYVASLGEPSTCTTPFRVLAASHPGLYLFRSVYEARAPHSADQLPATDMVRFLVGQLTTGFFTTSFPPTAVTPAKLPG
jgi:hypothetical protein